MSLMLSFYRAYPLATVLTLLALTVAGFAEGIGLSALLPLFNIAINSDASIGATAGNRVENEFEQLFQDAMLAIGVQPTVPSLLVLMVIMVIIKSATLLVAQRQVGYTAARLATDLRLNLLRAVLLSRWEYFLNQPVGKLTNALATEAQRASEAFINGATALTFLAQAVAYGAVALAVSWEATLIGIGAGSTIIFFSHRLVRMTKKAGRKQTSVLTSLMSTMTDTLMSVKPLKGMGREHLADTVLSIETTQLNQALRKQVLSGALLEAMQELLFAFIIAIGMFVALETFEMPLATVMVLVVTIGRMVALLGKVQKQYQKAMLSESAYWSVKQTIEDAEAEREQLHSGDVPQLRDSLRFEKVRFAYAERTILDDIDIEIPAGSVVTLIGPSGSGKTTVVDLVIGLLSPAGGAITIDGTPLDQIDTRQWRRSIGYVPQETLLLHDTVAHNVTLGDEELTDADVEAALRDAGAWDFVSRLDNGMHTMVGERGGKLSGGQRQRIVIARALVRKPQLLILDEATSALDAESVDAVQKTLERLRGKLTILSITHQNLMLDASDRSYRLVDGKAVLQ